MDQVDFALQAGDMASVQRERDLAERRAIAAVWFWFIRNPNRYDVPFSAIVVKVRARCPSADIEHVKAEFARRHRRALQRGVWG